MSAELFALPFAGRCLHPNPEPPRPRLQKGGRVIWIADREEGLVVAVNGHSVSIEWDESEFGVYALTSLAARERIIALESEEEDEP